MGKIPEVKTIFGVNTAEICATCSYLRKISGAVPGRNYLCGFVYKLLPDDNFARALLAANPPISLPPNDLVETAKPRKRKSGIHPTVTQADVLAEANKVVSADETLASKEMNGIGQTITNSMGTIFIESPPVYCPQKDNILRIQENLKSNSRWAKQVILKRIEKADR